MLAKLLEDLAKRKARKFGVATDVEDLTPLQNSPRFSQPIDLPDTRKEQNKLASLKITRPQTLKETLKCAK